ncbi:MAG TPA: hypothetical protein V6D08_21270 [Candidatus Obscuribacterales bacterium]
MSERTKLLKKAVLTGVGATTNVDRVKTAVREAMDDLVKVGHDLLDDLESKGKVKAESVQNFLRNLQDEAAKRTNDFSKTASSKVQSSMKKAAKELGLLTRDDLDELLERLNALEEALTGSEEEGRKSPSKRRRSSQE